jgi:hypothetical protein
MTVSLGKDRKCTAEHLTATHATVTELTVKLEGCGKKLYVDNFFTFLELFIDFTRNNCCGTVRLNKKRMPEDLRYQTVKLVWERDIGVRTRVDLTAVQLLGKRDAYMLTFTVHHRREVSVVNRKAIKLDIWWIITVTWCQWIRKTEGLIATQQPSDMEMYDKVVFPSVRSACSGHFILLASCGGKKISH